MTHQSQQGSKRSCCWAAARCDCFRSLARSPALSPSDDFATRAQSVSFNSSTLALNMSSAKIVQVTFWRLNLASYNNEIHFKATTCWQLSRAQNFLARLSLCGGKGKELVDASQIIFSCVLCFFSLTHTRAPVYFFATPVLNFNQSLSHPSSNIVISCK